MRQVLLELQTLVVAVAADATAQVVMGDLEWPYCQYQHQIIPG